MNGLIQQSRTPVAVLILIGFSILYVCLTFSPFKLPINPAKNHHSYENSYLDPIDALKQFPVDFDNATAVFNTVNSALRQKDANTHPIGVSFIPAYIPANTRLYHSRSDFNLPELYEWIAFSPEFSYNFIPFRRKVEGEEEGEEEIDEQRDEYSILDISGKPKTPGSPPPGLPSHSGAAAMFTFRTKVPLDKVIYLDGASAAKRSPEMDQQAVLSNISDVDGPWGERKAADIICKWGKPFGLQGIIRLEVGFEMILCDFHKDVEVISNVSLSYVNDILNFPADEKKNLPVQRRPPKGGKPPSGGGEKPPMPSGSAEMPPPPPANPSTNQTVDYDSLSFNRSLLLNHLQAASSFEWARSGSAVDFGESRVLLDFSNMVTPLNKTYIDPDSFRRNISYIDQKYKDEIKLDLERVFQSPVNPYHKTNWQGMTSHLVNKFAPILGNLNKTLHLEIDYKVLANSIQVQTFNSVRRYTHTEIKEPKIQREMAVNEMIRDYVFHSSPLHSTDYLIYSSIVKIQTEITNVIFDSFDLSKRIIEYYYLETGDLNVEEDVNELRVRISEMLERLNWTIFYQCSRKCEIDEFCYTPTWGPSPFGWGPVGNNQFTYDGSTYRLHHEFRCIKYNDVARGIPPI